MTKTNLAGQTTAPSENAPDMTLVLSPRRMSKVLPPGYSWLSAPIRTETLDHLHIQARLSRLSFRDYIERWCQEAFAFTGAASVQGNLPESVPPSTNGGRP
jgi:hypothetical protein